MTALVGAVLILAVAAAVASPLVAGARSSSTGEERPAERAELLEREKNVALMAIKEADFDLAMGKLSNDDYASLRGVYEERVLGALGELDAIGATRSADATAEAEHAAFCTACGAPFGQDDRFCAACGSARDRRPT